jgi:hypothetical protein
MCTTSRKLFNLIQRSPTKNLYCAYMFLYMTGCNICRDSLLENNLQCSMLPQRHHLFYADLANLCTKAMMTAYLHSHHVHHQVLPKTKARATKLHSFHVFAFRDCGTVWHLMSTLTKLPGAQHCCNSKCQHCLALPFLYYKAMLLTARWHNYSI